MLFALIVAASNRHPVNTRRRFKLFASKSKNSMARAGLAIRYVLKSIPDTNARKASVVASPVTSPMILSNLTLAHRLAREKFSNQCLELLALDTLERASGALYLPSNGTIFSSSRRTFSMP